eukprot:TRINITY_DN44852_c0_g1_i1.p1 TRINITY_DN44852_c0_g1~~TRINITY_DN44852_c0_g1_i1.p1  ORF type:complete len:248 (+),score=34.49 TRINITY_DN44852_c0_g1_i1:84-827(+)
MDAAALLAAAHGTGFRAFCKQLDHDFGGLGVAARHACRMGPVTNKMSKSLMQLDDAFAFIRHASLPKCNALCMDLQDMLDTTVDTKGDIPRFVPEAADDVKALRDKSGLNTKDERCKVTLNDIPEVLEFDIQTGQEIGDLRGAWVPLPCSMPSSAWTTIYRRFTYGDALYKLANLIDTISEQGFHEMSLRSRDQLPGVDQLADLLLAGFRERWLPLFDRFQVEHSDVLPHIIEPMLARAAFLLACRL